MNKSIYYHDTDCGGIVYYANYLKYFEEARTEYLRGKGIILNKLAEEGNMFVVRDVSITYKSPARYGDRLEIFSKIEKAKNASLVFYQEVYRGKNLLVSAKTTLVCIDIQFNPVVMPQKMLALIDGN
ncbi:MAG: YbgC/FadM family acyl-CoA thioesterase [Candidatus Omnitrophota bacterium]|nr:YbgC/FadM family acyl-CoA thioesterase [Candidatus Omnitrophota bacterium]